MDIKGLRICIYKNLICFYSNSNSTITEVIDLLISNYYSY